MKPFRNLLLVSACLTSFLHISFASDSSLSEEGQHTDTFQMGFEVETSGIKVQHDNEDEILVILESADGKWQLTSDTKDKRIDSTNWVNLECRTVGGLTQGEVRQYTQTTKLIMSCIKNLCDKATDGQALLTKDSASKELDLDSMNLRWGSADQAKRCLNKVIFATKRQVNENDPLPVIRTGDGYFIISVFTKHLSQDPNSKIGVNVKLVPGKEIDDEAEIIAKLKYKVEQEFRVMAKVGKDEEWELDSFRIIHLLGRNLQGEQFTSLIPQNQAVTLSNRAGVFVTLDCVLRPQLSFSFPLTHMHKFFDMLRRYDATTPRFLRISEELSKTPPRFGRAVEEERRARIRSFEALSISDKISSGIFQPELRGFCLLVLSYIYELFVLNQTPLANSETGPKAFLKVVSRVPFSQMYQQLPDSAQVGFIDFWNQLSSDWLDSLVKPYKRDAPNTGYEPSSYPKGHTIKEEERLSLLAWLVSIATPNDRIDRSAETNTAPVVRDMLSPPPYTEREYSMGAVDVSKVQKKHALVEARGYAGLQLKTTTYRAIVDISLDNIERLIDAEIEAFWGLCIGE